MAQEIEIKPTSCGGILTKDYTTHRGKLIKAGNFFECSRSLYNELRKDGYFEGFRKRKRKVKPVNK